MTLMGGFPYEEVQFDKRGLIFDNAEVSAVSNRIGKEGVSDLVLVVHGWKNNIVEAGDLYKELVENIASVWSTTDSARTSSRKLMFVGIHWPSKKYTPVKLQPGGGASLDDPAWHEIFGEELNDLQSFSDTPNAEALVADARQQIQNLESGDRPAQNTLVSVLLDLVFSNDDEDPDPEFDDGPLEDLENIEGHEILDRLSRPGIGEFASGNSGAAGLDGVFSGLKGGIMNLLNMTTYYEMKKRAGKVGRRGLHDMLKQLSAAHPELKHHLVGHSFGGRAVSAAARGPDSGSEIQLASLSLLQAAFSHHGFARDFDGPKDGYFLPVRERGVVSGPIVITHTRSDTAVGLAYPLASRVARDDQAGIGGPGDPYGSIGANGAQKTPVSQLNLQPPGGHYSLSGGTIYNLLADGLVKDHGDVRNPAVATLVVQTILAT